MNIPDELRYSSDHEWVRVEGENVRIGITEYAQDALGDVVFVQVPEVGSTLSSGASLGEVESTKSVSDIYSPVAGRSSRSTSTSKEVPSSSTAIPTAVDGSRCCRPRIRVTSSP